MTTNHDSRNALFQTATICAEELEQVTQNQLFYCPNCLDNVTRDEATNTCIKLTCSQDLSKETPITMEDYLGFCPEEFNFGLGINPNGVVIDVKYQLGASGQYRNVTLMLTFGGPTIYLDTEENSMIASHNNVSVKVAVSEESLKKIHEIYQQRLQIINNLNS